MRLLACLAALLLFPRDAWAWGLETHLFFAQWLLAAAPFADPQLRRAAARLPALVLAGACLPDLALAGKVLGLVPFRRAHEWATLKRMTSAPRDDADCALAIGYASHLVSDVVAHNDFVPEHEARIARVRHVTHAIAEFAMDQHVRGALRASPRSVLEAERQRIAGFAARAFRCDEAIAARGLAFLAGADGALRASPLPGLCRRMVERFYRDPAYRFDGYVARVQRELAGVEVALAGGFTDWVSSDPEGRAGDRATDQRTGRHVGRVVQSEDDAGSGR